MSQHIDQVGTTEVRRLMNAAVNYARHAQNTNNVAMARQHADRAMFLAAELDRRSALQAA